MRRWSTIGRAIGGLGLVAAGAVASMMAIRTRYPAGEVSITIASPSDLSVLLTAPAGSIVSWSKASALALEISGEDSAGFTSESRFSVNDDAYGVRLDKSKQRIEFEWKPGAHLSRRNGAQGADFAIIPTEMLIPEVRPEPFRWRLRSDMLASSQTSPEMRALIPWEGDVLQQASTRCVTLSGGRSVWRSGIVAIGAFAPLNIPHATIEWLIPASLAESVTQRDLNLIRTVDACFRSWASESLDAHPAAVFLPGREYWSAGRWLEPWIGVAVVTSCPEEEAIRNVARSLFWQVVIPKLRLDIEFENAERWVVQGCVELAADELAEAVYASDFREFRLQSRADRYELRQCEYVAASPLPFSFSGGPPPDSPAVRRRLYDRTVAPLAVEWVLGRLADPPLRRGAAESRQSLLREMLRSPNEAAGQLNRESSAAGLGADLKANPPALSFRGGSAHERVRDRAATAAERSVRVIVSDNSGGFLERCGCTLNQSGGAAKRSHLLRSMKQSGSADIAIHIGELLAPSPRGDKSETQLAFELERLVTRIASEDGYDAVVPGYRDLADRSFDPYALLHGSELSQVSCNLKDVEGQAAVPGYKLLRIHGMQEVLIVGVTVPPFGRVDAMGPACYEFGDRFRLAGIVASVSHSISEGLEQAVNSSDVTVVVAGEIPPYFAERIAESVPRVDLIVSSNAKTYRMLGGDLSKGTFELEAPSFRIGRTVVCFVAAQQFGVSVLELSLDGDRGAISDVSATFGGLDDSVCEEVEVRNLIDQFYAQVEHLMSWSGSAAEADARAERSFVGSTACQPCHSHQYAIWRQSRHARAFDTLLRVRRHMVPQCVVCHVVGLGADGGFRRTDEQFSGLAGVGCESCHGPGEHHISGPTRTNIRNEAGPSMCSGCHDAEHSAEFSLRFPSMLNEIRHWPEVER